MKSNPAKSPGVNTVKVCPAAVMASSTTVEPNGACVWKMAKSFGALWLLEKVKLTMLLAISVKLFGAKPIAKSSPTSNPQPGPGVAVGVGLAVGVGVGDFSPAGTAGAFQRSRRLEYGNLPRSRKLEYGNLGSCDWWNDARITVCLLAWRCASANGIAQTGMSRSRQSARP